MSTHNSDFMAALAAGKHNKGDIAGGRVRLYRGVADLAAVTVESGDTVNMVKLPEKGKLVGLRFGANVTLGTTTVKIGTADDDDAFRASATKTDKKPEELMTLPDCAGETIILTAGTADAPTSGKIWVDALVADV